MNPAKILLHFTKTPKKDYAYSNIEYQVTKLSSLLKTEEYSLGNIHNLKKF